MVGGISEYVEELCVCFVFLGFAAKQMLESCKADAGMSELLLLSRGFDNRCAKKAVHQS